MHTRGLKNDSLVTFSRYREPIAREQFDNLSSPPGLLQSLSLEMKQRNKILFFLEISSTLFSLSFPYLLLLVALSLAVPLILSNLNPLDIYTILLLIYTGTFLAVFALSLPKLHILIQVIESRLYLKSRNIDFRHTKRYYVLILAIFFFVSLPNFLVIIFFNSSFISDDFIKITVWWYGFLLLTFFSPGFYALPNLIDKSFGNHMHTYFTDKGLSILGQWRGQNYQMNFLKNDISSFVFVLIPYLELLTHHGTKPAFLVPEEPVPDGLSILYVRDQSGGLHLCSYFIQGRQLVQDVDACLAKHYPEVKIETVEDNAKFLSFIPNDFLSFFASNKRFTTLKTPFLYPRFIKPIQKHNPPLSNTPLPSAPDKSIKVENNENTSFQTSSISNFLSFGYPSAGSKTLFSVGYVAVLTSIVIVLSTCAIFFGAILQGTDISLSSLIDWDPWFFMATMILPLIALGITNCFVSMPKKWYRPGLIHVCLLLIILFTISYLLFYF